MNGAKRMIEVRLHTARQRGAVLVVGLLILLVMTLLGVTAMSTSTMQERMSANGMNANIAFQAAESAASAARSMATANAAMNSVTSVPGPPVTYGSNALTALGTTQVTYIGEGPAEGWSSTYSARNFYTSATGTVAAANARSATNQGWFRISPK